MKTEKSARVALWCGRVIALAVALLCVFLYDLLSWYHCFRSLSPLAAMAIFVGFYLCAPGVFYALWSMDKLLRNILHRNVFVTENVTAIRRIRLCCGWVSAVSLAAGFFYPPLMFLFAIMAFLCLSVTVVKNVMAAAVELREENDLTV